MDNVEVGGVPGTLHGEFTAFDSFDAETEVHVETTCSPLVVDVDDLLSQNPNGIEAPHKSKHRRPMSTTYALSFTCLFIRLV